MTKYRCLIQRDVYKYLCEENPNCYYKQLKLKEQECKNLKEELRCSDLAEILVIEQPIPDEHFYKEWLEKEVGND